MTGLGRLGTVTNGSFRESEFNDRFPAVNLKSGRSRPDPQPTFTPKLKMTADQQKAASRV